MIGEVTLIISQEEMQRAVAAYLGRLLSAAEPQPAVVSVRETTRKRFVIELRGTRPIVQTQPAKEGQP